MSQCSNNLAQIVANDDGTRNPGGVWQNNWPDKGGMTQPSGDLCNTLYTVQYYSVNPAPLKGHSRRRQIRTLNCCLCIVAHLPVPSKKILTVEELCENKNICFMSKNEPYSTVL